MTEKQIIRLCEKFAFPGNFLRHECIRSGHINDTFFVVFQINNAEKRYILQRINTSIFKNPEGLMDNIARVLTHCHAKLEGQPDAGRRAMTLIPTVDGKNYYTAENGNVWRVYEAVEDAVTYDVLESPEFAYQAAKAFGAFQNMLADLPGERLFEVIPNFHNTVSRLADFDKSLQADVCHRAASAQAEIKFVNDNRAMASVVVELMAKGELPERITHNDTKINNVMLDKKTGEGICVIDLDTIMPGSALYDFGDLVRTSTCPAAEDEKDLSKVIFKLDMFQALAKGFLEGCAGALTKKETELLPFAGMLITFENGIRFLTDYLDGDTYFKTSRPEHNLDRCRTQFKLVQELKNNESAMKDIVALSLH